MKGIARYNRAELEALIADTRREVGGDFAPSYLQGVAAQIGQRPAMYRSFGAYWWLLKRELIASGVRSFGTSVDAETADALDYGDRDLNLAACYVAQMHVLDTATVYGHRHAVELEDGSIVEFTLDDEEVEAIEVGRLIEVGVRVQ